jgi:hypothetical protein
VVAVLPALAALLPLVLPAGGVVATGGVVAGAGVIVSIALASLPLVRLPALLALDVLEVTLLLADLLPPQAASAVAAVRIAASLME